jgi:hypothetical protein
VVEGDAVASSSENTPLEDTALRFTSNPVIDDESLPPLATISPENDAAGAEREANGVFTPTIATQVLISTEATSSAPLPSDTESSTPEAATQTPVEPEVKLPVGHAYYFVQMFDADNQVLRTIGSFFSKLDANVKASIRRHLKRPIRQDFLMWKRVDGATVTAVSPADSFDDVVAPHGACFIVGDKLTKDK